jgi:hypothetical protein
LIERKLAQGLIFSPLEQCSFTGFVKLLKSPANRRCLMIYICQFKVHFNSVMNIHVKTAAESAGIWHIFGCVH